MRSFFLYSCLLLFLCQCASDQGNSNQEVIEIDSLDNSWKEKIVSQDEILSTHIGQDLEDFIARKAPVAVIEGEEYLMEGSLENGVPFSFYVSADKGKIYEMNLDLFPDSTALNSTFQDLLLYLDSLYHPSHPTDGYATWRKASAKGTLIEVTLADVSLEMGRPSIMINQLEHVERIYEE